MRKCCHMGLLIKQEYQKTFYLTLIFFLIIGSYWFLGLLKDTVFFKLAFPTSLGWPDGYGRLMQPIARLWSPLFVLLFVLIYSKLVDLVTKTQLFYILGTFFTSSFFIMGLVITAKYQYGDVVIGKTALAATGWIGFFLADIYGSIMTALFWSFAVSLMSVDEANKNFPFIIAGAQIGSISGSLLTIVAKKTNTIWPMYFIGCGLIMLVMVCVYIFNKKFQLEFYQTKKTYTGFLAGIKLLLQSKYLLAIFIISTFYEVAISIVDYQMKSFLDISTIFEGAIGFAYFSTLYGTAVNTCALMVALFGSRYLLKKVGANRCLLIYPVFFAIALIFLICTALINFNTEHLLWITLCILILAKGLTYGLNNPSRDIMYIPTSDDAKFKTKGFTETFGSRAALMTGASMSNALKGNLIQLTIVGSALSLGFVGIWLLAAMYLARMERYTKNQ